MPQLLSVATRFCVAALIGSSIAPVNAFASSRAAWPAYTVVVENATAPPGWKEFCARYRSECDHESIAPRKIAFSAQTRTTIAEVNNSVNNRIKPQTDMKHWGRDNKWTFAEDGRGDCKDYVLLKRRKLLEAGFPREALLITIVWTRQNQGHAVLIVRTDQGDYVMDSLSPKIVLWSQTSYDFVMRQSQSHPNKWVFIDGDPMKPSSVAANAFDGDPRNQPTVALGAEQAGNAVATNEVSEPAKLAPRKEDEVAADPANKTIASQQVIPAE